MNETERIVELLMALDCEQVGEVLMGFLTYIDDQAPTNFDAEDFCYHLRSAVVILQQRTAN